MPSVFAAALLRTATLTFSHLGECETVFDFTIFVIIISVYLYILFKLREYLFIYLFGLVSETHYDRNAAMYFDSFRKFRFSAIT